MIAEHFSKKLNQYRSLLLPFQPGSVRSSFLLLIIFLLFLPLFDPYSNTSTKIKLHKFLVKSLFLCGTRALTLTGKERLKAFHRKQLKKILNISYPKKITNISLYRICQENSLSLQILSACWSLFGHILRRIYSSCFRSYCS